MTCPLKEIADYKTITNPPPREGGGILSSRTTPPGMGGAFKASKFLYVEWLHVSTLSKKNHTERCMRERLGSLWR